MIPTAQPLQLEPLPLPQFESQAGRGCTHEISAISYHLCFFASLLLVRPPPLLATTAPALLQRFNISLSCSVVGQCWTM